MKNSWHIEDLVDLEFFLQQIEQEEIIDSPSSRDREIYLQRIAPKLPAGTAPSRRLIVKLWLESRREIEKEERGSQSMLPGEIFSQVRRLVAGGLLFAGILSGGWLAASLLSYRGTEPVNVSLYVVLLVLTQAGLATITTLFLLMRGLHWRVSGGLPYTLLRSLLIAVLGLMRKKLGERVTGERRAEFAAVIGLLKGRGAMYGSLFFWPFFLLVQTFGVGFNLGALFSTGLRVVGTDLAFGWQSTLQLSAEAVHRLVRGISLPWSWLLPPDIAAPSLSQIEGSRMVLKDGIYHLSTADLVAWWPFLLLALIFYGLIPRLFLLLVGATAQRRALSLLEFNNSACDRLLQRLERPTVRLDGTVTPALGEEALVGEVNSSGGVPLDTTRLWPGIALIPDDVFDACSPDRLNNLVKQSFGIVVNASLKIGQGLAADHEGIRQLMSEKAKSESSSVFILQEAWHPPIRETLTFFKEIRTILGPEGRIGVGLIGKPAAGTIFTPVEAHDLQTWRRKIASLGDLNLRLERLVEDN